MPLFENGQITQNGWQTAQEGVALPEGDVLVPPSRLAEGLGRNGAGRLGVVLEPADRVESLREALPRLDLVCVTFASFRNGRALSQARALREHLGYTGTLRAAGHILPDQYEFLLRCGVSQVEIPQESDPVFWQEAHTRFTVAYQPSVLDEKPEGTGLRRWLLS